jgi:hypothetical protein
MQLAKGIKLEQGTTIILTDDKYISALQAKFGVHMDRLKFLSPWPEFQSYVSFNDESLFGEQSGQYRSEGGLQIKINFTNMKLLDMNSETTFRIINIFDIKGIKIITIPGMIITQDLMDRFVAAYWVFVGPDMFRLLAKTAKPRDVVRLCGANQKLRGWCNKDFYAQMLRHHYGQESPTPAETFRDIARPKLLHTPFILYSGKDPIKTIYTEQPLPLLEKDDSCISIFVDVGDTCMMLLTKNGNVWARGENKYGQLCGESLTADYGFFMIAGLKDIVNIVLTNRHSYFLDKNGQLFAAGISFTTIELIFPTHATQDLDRVAFLDDGNFDPILIAENVVSINNVAEYMCGVYKNGFPFVCSDTNTIDNYDDKTGSDYDILERSNPGHPTYKIIDIEYIGPRGNKTEGHMVTSEYMGNYNVYLDIEGVVWLFYLPNAAPWAISKYEPIKLTDLPKIVSIKTKDYKVVCLDQDGNVWVVGVYSNSVKLDFLPKIASLVFTYLDVMAFIDVDGNVWCGDREGQNLDIYKINNVKDVISFATNDFSMYFLT